MADIVWYPGHMAKAKRLIKEALPQIDLVIELLDARAPISGRNPDFNSLFSAKPTLTILTKTSLADRRMTDIFTKKLASAGHAVIAVDCKTGYGIEKIAPAVKTLMREKLARDAARGIKKPVRAMIVGITNVGKSTLVNTLCGSKKAKVEDKAGVTRHNSWIPIPSLGLELMDTPGLLWHKFDDQRIGIKLACIGSINDDILDTTELSQKLIGLIKTRYAEQLCARYKIEIDETDSDLEIFEKIARKRGFIRTGGAIDEERTGAVIIDEFRAGKTGNITLDWE